MTGAAAGADQPRTTAPAAVVAPATATTRAQRWQQVRRLLAVRLDNLGDVLMTTPALAALREGLPHAHITLLASPAGALAASHLPMVDAVLPFAAPWMQRPSSRPDAEQDTASLGRAEAALVDRLAEAHFDAVVIFTVCTQSALPAALLCRLAGIPLRLAHSRENPYALLTDWAPDNDTVVQTGMRHEVQRQLDLVATVGLRTTDPRMRFAVHAADRMRAASRLADVGIDPQAPYAVLHPGATAESRRWPAPRFGIAADAIAAQGVATVFTGGPQDLGLVTQARQAMARPAASLAGELALGELAALIESAAVVVANNSAPTHLAAALGTPVVSLYALTNPQHTPWQVNARVLNHDVPCRWCLKSVCPQLHHDCLRRVQPPQVADAALQLMGSAVRFPTRLPAAAVLEFRP